MWIKLISPRVTMRPMDSQFYSWANILRRWPVAAGQATAYVEFNLLYRKFGKITCFLGKAFGMRNLAKLAKALAYPAWNKPRHANAKSPGTVLDSVRSLEGAYDL